MAPTTRAKSKCLGMTSFQSLQPTSRSSKATQGLKDLCFRDAWKALQQKEISESEYFHFLLVHYTGVKHPQDTNQRGSWDVTNDLLGQAIYSCAVVDKSYAPLKSTNMCEQLFTACVRDDDTTVATVLEESEFRAIRPQLVYPLTVLACQKGAMKVFRVCVKDPMFPKVKMSMVLSDFAVNHPQMLDILWNENWKDIQSSLKPLYCVVDECMKRRKGNDGAKRVVVLQWILDHGGRLPLPAQELKMIALWFPSLEVIRFLLDWNPKNILRFGMLQWAASYAEIDLVKLLLEAGADPNQDPPSMGDIREPGPFRALWMAVTAERLPYTEAHLEVARLLLEAGANMNLPASPPRRIETALTAAKNKEDPRMLRLFETYMEK